MRPLACLAAVGLACAVPAFAAEPANPRIAQLVASVDAARIRQTVARLVAFGTRSTISGGAGKRGIVPAREWLAREFAELARQKGSRLTPLEDRFTAEAGPRVPAPVEIVNVGAVLPGTDPARAKEAIVLTGHYDSRSADILDPKADAPGANDDGSGVAVVLELARALSSDRPAVSVYFVAVAGEEQGLLGSLHLARRLRSEGVDVLAMASLDMVGNTEGQDGLKDDVTVRVFSEGVPAVETPAQGKLRSALGAENDAPAREWARYVKRDAERYVENLDPWLMLRQDRIARGSDHMSFSREGWPAIRVTETHESWDRQHQVPRTVNGRAYGDDAAHVDAAYAAKVGRGVLAAVAELAAAPEPIRDLALGGAGSPDTRLRVKLPADARVAGLVVYRRRADAVAWERADRFSRQDLVVLKDVVPDNWVFAVATVDADGNESLPTHPTRLE